MMDHSNMDSRMDKIEATMQFILEQQAASSVKQDMLAETVAKNHADLEASISRFVAATDVRQALADQQTAQLRRVLLSAIRLGRHDRSKMNQLINALTDSQLRVETKLDRLLPTEPPTSA